MQICHVLHLEDNPECSLSSKVDMHAPALKMNVMPAQAGDRGSKRDVVDAEPKLRDYVTPTDVTLKTQRGRRTQR